MALNREKKKATDNLNYRSEKEEIQQVAEVKNPKVFDIGKILLLKRLARQGDFNAIKKLKGPMYDYLTPAERRLLKKGGKE